MLLTRIADPQVRQQVEKTLVLWELGYVREALSQFRIAAEQALRLLIGQCEDEREQRALMAELERGRPARVVERLYHELERVPARVGLQLHTLLAWGNYGSHHQKLGHEARPADLLVLISIAVDLCEFVSNEALGQGSIYQRLGPVSEGLPGPPGGPGGPSEIQRRWVGRVGAAVQPEPHRLVVPSLSVELIWSRPPGATAGSEPYRGLLAFDLEDAERFYGRTGLMARLEQSVDTRRLTVLSGASGAGKTSLLRAGLAPWLLELGCGVLLLSDYSALSLDLVEEALDHFGEKPLVLVLDQLERVLLGPDDTGLTARCVTLLLGVGDGGQQGRRGVASLREEHLGPLLREVQRRGKEEVLGDGQAIVVAEPLTLSEAREAITRPLGSCGFEMEPALLDEVLLPELSEPSGTLPARLQMVCSRLYDEALRRGQRRLDRDLYQSLGGGRRILGTYLDEALSSETYRGEEGLARAVLKAMTGPEVRCWEGVGEIWQRLHDAGLVTDEVQLRSLLGRLMDDRLVASRSGGPGAPTRYSLMHDELTALVQAWRSPMELERQEAQELMDRALARFSDPQRRELLRGRSLRLVQRHVGRLRGGREAEALLQASRQSLRRRRVGLTVLGAAAIFGLLFGAVQLHHATAEQDRAVQLVDQGLILRAQLELDRDPTLAMAWLRNLSQSTSGVEALALFEEARRRGVARVLMGHRQLVTHVAFAPDGRVLASASRDGDIRLWDLGGARPLRGPLRGHSAAVRQLAFSPDGRLLASASLDGTVRLWHLPSGAPGKVLAGQGGAMHAVAFAPDGAQLVLAGDDPGLQVFGTDGRLRRRLAGTRALAQPVVALAFSTDGQWVWAVDRDGQVQGLSLVGGEVRDLSTLGSPAAPGALCILPDQGQLFVATTDGQVQGRSLVGKGTPPTPFMTRGPVSVLACSTDGRLVAWAGSDKQVHVRAIDDEDERLPLKGHLGAIHGLAFSPDGRFLASASRDTTVRLWDLQARGPEAQAGHRRLYGHEREVWSLAFLPDGKRLVSGGTDRTVRLWDLSGMGRAIARVDHGDEVFSVAVSSDGNRLAAAGWNGRLSLFRLGGPLPPSRTHALVEPGGAIYSATFSPDNQVLALALGDGRISLRHGTTLKALGTPFLAHHEAVLALAFTRDGGTLLSAGRDGSLQHWDPATRRPRGRIQASHSAAVHSLALSPDGDLLASGSADGLIRLFALPSGPPRDPPLSGHHHWVLALAFSPDGRTLASASSDSTIRLWDPARSRPLGPPLHGHLDWVYALAFSPDGRTLASASADSSIMLWSLAESRLPHLHRRIDALTNLHISLGGRLQVR